MSASRARQVPGWYDGQPRFGPEALNQALPRSGVFDDDGVGAPLVGEIAARLAPGLGNSTRSRHWWRR